MGQAYPLQAKVAASFPVGPMPGKTSPSLAAAGPDLGSVTGAVLPSMPTRGGSAEPPLTACPRGFLNNDFGDCKCYDSLSTFFLQPLLLEDLHKR